MKTFQRSKWKVLSSLMLVLISHSSDGQSQSDFGDKRLASLHLTYLPGINGETSSYFFTHSSFLISVHNNIYAGVYYGHVAQRFNNFSSVKTDIFHRGGIMTRYRFPFANNRGSLNTDLAFAYSNFSVDPDGENLIPYINYQIGINGLIDYTIYKSLRLSGGFIGHRTLKRGDYGFELLPMVGLTLDF